MQRRAAFAAIMATARGFAVNGDEVRLAGPCLSHPCREAFREQDRIDAIHQDGQPAPAWHAMMVGKVAAQEVEMSRSPVGDQIVIVTVADRAADDQKQHFRQRARHPPRLARILDDGKMIQKRLQAGVLKTFEGGNRHGSAPNHRSANGISQSSIAKAR
jgi:hypothetical protein